MDLEKASCQVVDDPRNEEPGVSGLHGLEDPELPRGPTDGVSPFRKVDADALGLLAGILICNFRLFTIHGDHQAGVSLQG